MPNIRERKLYSLDAFIFYVDGIVTKTEDLEKVAWQKTLDELLLLRSPKEGQTKEKFDPTDDYTQYLKNKPLIIGLPLFLKTRNIFLPLGGPGDDEHKGTIYGIMKHKDKNFEVILEEEGIEVCVATLGFIESLKERGFLIGAASFNKNCKLMLEFAGIEDIFDAVIDGVEAERLNIPEKPQGNIYTNIIGILGSDPKRTAIVEDSALGMQAAVNSGMGLVIGYAHNKNEQELKENRADFIIKDFETISYDNIEVFMRTRGQNL